MSVPNSVEELIQLIRKSGMIDEQKLTAYLSRRQLTRGLSTDPREFADEMVADGILTNFQCEQYLLGKWRGFTIGKYKLLERIGVGGMGQVFLCEHMFMKKRVAVKVLPPAKADQPAALGRFYREARAAGSLDHPNVVRTQDIDQDGNLHFIVMDYVDGPNLLEVIKRSGPMDVSRATYYMRQVAAGLDYAFRSGIIHRDVKPGNVLLDRKGTAKILDMGLARFFKDHADQLTIKYDDKIVLGTADYVAPEQVANSHSVDIRADIYGLGATFYFLLAGHPPFPTGTVSQKLLWHRTKEPTPIRQIRQDVPEGLAAVLGRMMAKDPKARYQTPAQLVAELEPWLPAEVPTLRMEELPQLSPAALEGAAVEVEQEALAEPVAAGAGVVATKSGSTEAKSTVRSGSVAIQESTRPPLNPFGPPSSPLGKSGSQTPPPSRPVPPPPVFGPRKQAVVETVASAPQHTPNGAASPFKGSNPFSGGDIHDKPAQQDNRMVLIGAGVAVILGLLIAILKVAL
jgi:serine/threonine protein kinase